MRKAMGGCVQKLCMHSFFIFKSNDTFYNIIKIWNSPATLELGWVNGLLADTDIFKEEILTANLLHRSVGRQKSELTVGPSVTIETTKM